LPTAPAAPQKKLVAIRRFYSKYKDVEGLIEGERERRVQVAQRSSKKFSIQTKLIVWGSSG
jgi:hypothetical protein